MSKARNYMLTVFDMDSFKHDDYRVRYAVWQKEICTTTEREHFQVYMEFTVPLSIKQVQKAVCVPNCHVEARKRSREDARHYSMCQGEECPCGKTYRFDKEVVEPPTEYGTFEQERGKRTDLVEAKAIIQKSESWQDVINNDHIVDTIAKYTHWAKQVYDMKVDLPKTTIVLREWQTQVIDLLMEEVKERRIIWIWSRESNTGKSTFSIYIDSKFRMLYGTDYANTLYAYDNEKVIWFDLSRHQTHEHIPYHALEQFSNKRRHLSSKYHSVMKYVSAHVVVTANVPPDETKIPERCVIFYASLQ